MLLGMMSFAQDGSIIETNQEARRILAEKDGIWLAGNTLCVDSSQESRELQRMIRSALADSGAIAAPDSEGTEGPGVVEAMSITRPSGRAKLGVLVRAVPLGQWSESKQRPAVVVFLRDPESNAAQPSQELVRRLFGLTRMEAQLALLLAEGLTLDEAAEKMNVRRNTARTHLRSIFCKTGVTRQTMLVRLLLNSVLTLG
jgi:DNA-binding CsgD family transcriptional regulator